MDVPPQELPFGYQWFSEQIAGHHPSVVKNGIREIGIVKKSGSDKLLKPKQEGSRGECEVNVYKLLARALRHSASGDVGNDSGDDADSNDYAGARIEDVKEFAHLTPAFHGMTSVAVNKNDHDFLELDDVTISYTRPAILDVKMGKITYDPLASAFKRRKEASKYPPQTRLGFRLLGYRMHLKDGSVIVRDKDWGKNFDEKNIIDGLLEFFSGRGTDLNLISEALSRLDRVRRWFAVQKSFHFYASSLLFVYENDPLKPPNTHLVMIDFSHVFPANNDLDYNYLYGLHNLYSKMEDILSKFTFPQS